MPRSLLPLCCLLTVSLGPTVALAQSITPAPDGTQTVVTPVDRQYDITGGTASADGANLFHSFEQFGLNPGEIANFIADPTVQTILGRVIGGQASVINGLVQVSGSAADLYLLNPSGILFGPQAALNIDGAFTATTATGVGFGDRWLTVFDTPDYADLVGPPTELGFALETAGAIANGGQLAVGSGQSITLAGGSVINTGTLSAPGGQITVLALPGENRVRIQADHSLLSLDLDRLPPAAASPQAVPFTPLDLPTLLANSPASLPTLTPHGDGTVTLAGAGTAIAAGAGTAIAAGVLTVAGRTGGTVQLLGDQVSLVNGTIDASGPAGGGTVRIGGDYRGQGPLPRATQTRVDGTSTITAAATSAGDGGRVWIWADDQTTFAGQIGAEGGPLGGNGGLVETSGRAGLAIAPGARVTTQAPHGQLGSWLLDPADLAVVATGGTALIDPVGGTNIPTTATTIDAGTVVAALEFSNVTLQATNTITVNAAIDASRNPGPGDLTLLAPTANLNQRISLYPGSNLAGTATTVNVGAAGSVQNGIDVATSGGTVNLAPTTYREGMTITLDRDLSLQGSGLDTLLDGQGLYQVLAVSPEVTATIRDLTLTNGDNTMGTGRGGGLVNDGTLTLTNVRVTDNLVSGAGGGIFNAAASMLTLDNVTVSGNEASEEGGGIYSEGSLTLRGSTVADNVAEVAGGGIWNGGSLTVDTSTLSGNVATGVTGLGGGGIWNESSATLTLSRSTLANNRIDAGGGAGIGNYFGAIATITNSTLSGNQANNLAFGGGIATAGTLILENSTLTLNGADIGGGLDVVSSPAFVRNSILAGNQGRSFGVDIAGPIVSQGRNLVGNTSGASGFSSADLRDVNPRLGPLANNGGPTLTHGLLPDSPAIDAAGVGATAADQRGVAAVGNRDIGAFEFTAGGGGTGVIPPEPCEADCRGEQRPNSEHNRQQERPGGDRVVITAQPQNSPEAKVRQTESEFATEFASYFGLPATPAAADLGRTQQALQAVQAATGQVPALVFVSFGVSALGGMEGQPTSGSDANPLEIILILPTGEPIYRQIPGTSKRQVLNTIERLRRQLTDPNLTTTTTYLTAAQQLYRWLIAPIATDLETQGVTSLNFVMDSGLRLLPVAALHDGQRFLIESYSVSLIPSVSLVDLTYHDIRNDPVLIGGTAQFVTQSPLPAAPVEIQLIAQTRPGETLIDGAFTPAALRQARQQTPYPLIHLATHGAFLRGTPADSYLQFADGRLKLNQIRQLGWNQPPVELVTLSACETAIGNREAELGFAGLAVASGARSAMASLWAINDESTAGFMGAFYQQLQQAPIRAEALRQAQLAMLRGEVYTAAGELVAGDQRAALPPELVSPEPRQFTHPFYWAAFTLVGSPW